MANCIISTTEFSSIYRKAIDTRLDTVNFIKCIRRYDIVNYHNLICEQIQIPSLEWTKVHLIEHCALTHSIRGFNKISKYLIVSFIFQHCRWWLSVVSQMLKLCELIHQTKAFVGGYWGWWLLAFYLNLLINYWDHKSTSTTVYHDVVWILFYK